MSLHQLIKLRAIKFLFAKFTIFSSFAKTVMPSIKFNDGHATVTGNEVYRPINNDRDTIYSRHRSIASASGLQINDENMVLLFRNCTSRLTSSDLSLALDVPR